MSLNTIILQLLTHFLLSQFKDRYLDMYGAAGANVPTKKGKTIGGNIKKLLRELAVSDDEEPPSAPVPVDPRKPWLKEFRAYLDAVDEVLDGMTLIQWWGVSHLVYVDL